MEFISCKQSSAQNGIYGRKELHLFTLLVFWPMLHLYHDDQSLGKFHPLQYIYHVCYFPNDCTIMFQNCNVTANISNVLKLTLWVLQVFYNLMCGCPRTWSYLATIRNHFHLTQ